MIAFVALLRLISAPPDQRVLGDLLFLWIGAGSFSAGGGQVHLSLPIAM